MEEGCDHELSVWSIGWMCGSITNQKSKFVRGPMISLVLNLLNLRCLWDIYQQVFVPDTVHREYWNTFIDMSYPQVSTMLLANRSGAEVRGIW